MSTDIIPHIKTREENIESEDWSNGGEKEFTKAYYDVINSKMMDYRVASLEARLNLVDKQFDTLASEMKSLRWWILGTGIGSVVAVMAAIICLTQYQASWFQNSINANQSATDKLNEEMDKRWQAINAEQQKRFEAQMQAWGFRVEKLEK